MRSSDVNKTTGLLARWQVLLHGCVGPVHTSGVLVLLDHGLFSGTHFVVNVLLARWMSAGEYGAFTTAYALFLLLATFHNAMLVEPVLVFGPGKYANDLKGYFGSVLKLHLLVGVAVAIALLFVASILWWTRSDPLDRAIVGLALASPLILLLWLVRRAFYVSLAPQWSVVGGAVYLCLAGFGIYLTRVLDVLQPGVAFAVLGCAALLTGFFLTAKLQPRWRASEATRLAVVIGDCGTYGGWAVGVGLTVWLLNNLAYLGLAAFGFLADTGALRALMNIAMPFQHFVIASAAFLLPRMAEMYHHSNSHEATVRRRPLSLLLIAAGLYSVLMVLFGERVSAFIYSGKYTFTTMEIGAASMLPVLWAFATVYSTTLKAKQNPRSVLFGYLAGAIMALVVMAPFIVWWGLSGALAGWVLSMVTASMTLGIIHGRVSGAVRSGRQPEEHGGGGGFV